MLPDREVGELECHQQADAHGRQEKTNPNGCRLYDIEMDRVDTHPLSDRKHDGDQDNGGRQTLEHHAEQHGDRCRAEQEEPVMILERSQYLAEQFWYALDSHQILEDRRYGEQEDYRRRQDGAVVSDLAHLRPGYVPIVELGGQKGVPRNYRTGFGCGDDAEEEPTQDDDGYNERHGCARAGTPDAAETRTHVDGPVVLASPQQYETHQAKHNDERRKEAGEKQRHGRGVGDLGDNDHEDRRRDQHSHGGSGRYHRGRIGLPIAGLRERWHQGGAQCRDLGHLRSADVREEVGDHDYRHAQTAAHPAHEGARELDECVAHTAPFHETAGEHEGRDCQQHPALRARYERGGKLLHGITADPQAHDPRGREREHDRHGEQQQYNEDGGDGKE